MMEYKVNFDTLSQGDPIIRVNDKDEHFISIFLEKWNTVYDVNVLLEYLDIISLDQKEHEDYQDIVSNGIYDDVQSTLFFKDKIVYIIYNDQQSKDIELSCFKNIVLKWKKYLEKNNKI